MFGHNGKVNYHSYPIVMPKNVNICKLQLHGFSDASEDAYAGVVYIHGLQAMQTCDGRTAGTPNNSAIRIMLTCQIASLYLIEDIYAWTDSTIVLNWLDGSPRRFKTFVGNRVSTITDLIPSQCWNHVCIESNPVDCALRGLFPNKLVNHEL